MTTADPPSARPGPASPRRAGPTPKSVLAPDRLGIGQVVGFSLTAATPMTVVAGVVVTGYAVTGVTAIPVAFVVVGLVLVVFAVGYVAMARHMANAGALYSYVAQGLGRPVGVGAAWTALVAYNALQVGLYGAIGAAAGPLLDTWFGITPSWWVIAAAAWTLTAVCGLCRVDVSGWLLARLLAGEIAIIAVFSAADLAEPAAGAVSTATLNPAGLTGPDVGAVLVLAVLGFIGFESAVVFSEEARDARRTIPIATYVCVGVSAVVYAVASWSMSVATGPDQIVQTARDAGPELFFTLATDRLGGWADDVGHLLFVTSLLAAMVSFHNTIARYTFALARERVLPARLARTSRRTGAPVAASLTQSAVGAAVIALFAVTGWDPVVQLFYWGGTTGGIGVLTLLGLTSAAVVGFFSSPLRRPDSRSPRPGMSESLWVGLVAPTAAWAALVTGLVLALVNLPTVLGVPDGHPMTVVVPLSLLAALSGGMAYALLLQRIRPEVYAGIGYGAKANLIAVTPARESGIRASEPGVSS